MRATLRTPISVQRFAVFAEMAWLERRPELGLLCQEANDGDGRISPTLIQSLLPGIEDVGARNILDWCRMLGLCDEGGALRDLGREVAETHLAPVPEQGVYDLWVAQHPLLGKAILQARRLSSQRDPHLSDLQPLPMQPDRDTPFPSAVDPRERFILRDLPSQHGEIMVAPRQTQSQCILTWSLDFDEKRDQWHLEGQLDGNDQHPLAMDYRPRETRIDLWSLIQTWGRADLRQIGIWQPEEERLDVSFEGLSVEAQEAFMTDLTLPKATVPGKGSFKDVLLEDVPIGPRTQEDGEQWASARLDRRLQGDPRYRTRADLRRLFLSVVEETPLENTHPTLFSHDEVLRVGADALGPEVFWSLAAPVDLAPQPVPAAELEAFRVAEPTLPEESVSPPEEAPTQVRIPHRGGWSMAQLIRRLLLGERPARLLLCDRYVRGDRNLGTLSIFTQSLREIAPEILIEVWTEAEGDNFKTIQAITGGPVSTYAAHFKGDRPHDRYILIQTQEGSHLSWQISNSPLDARAERPDASPRTPLRWRDLAASRVEVEGLIPPLREWFKGRMS